MSRLFDGQQTLSPFPNPSRRFLPRKSYQSQKFNDLLNSFEKMLADVMKKLNPEDVSDIFSLSWMRLTIQFLIEIHTKIKTLVDDLYPALSWDNKWIQIYFDDTVQLLEICNAITSQLYHLEHGQLLIRYLQHIFDTATKVPSSEQLRKAHVSLHDWIKQMNSQSPNLQNGLASLQVLRGTLYVQKVKSEKENILMQALYGFKFLTVTVCSIFLAALSGSSRPLTDLPNPEKFLWIEAFHELKSSVSKAISMQLSSKKSIVFKEVEALRVCIIKLHELTDCCDEELVPQSNQINCAKEGNVRRKSADFEEQRVQECILRFSENGEKLGKELDGLSAQVKEFFKVVLSGRDALMCNLRASSVTKEK